MIYADNPNVLFVPFSNDRDYYWGMYTAPKSVIDDVDRIFAVLFFQRVHIPDAVSTADEAIAEKKPKSGKGRTANKGNRRHNKGVLATRPSIY